MLKKLKGEGDRDASIAETRAGYRGQRESVEGTVLGQGTREKAISGTGAGETQLVAWGGRVWNGRAGMECMGRMGTRRCGGA